MRSLAFLFVVSLLAPACSSNGSGSSSNTACDSVCAHASAAGCAKFDNADCLTSCRKEQSNASCAREFDAVASCFSSATVVCDKHGEPDVGSACDAAQSAFDKCVGNPGSDAGTGTCSLPSVPPSAPACGAAPPTPGTACSKKCDTCSRPPGVLWGPCVCDGAHWICTPDVPGSGGWPCDVTCP
ncbi:MAG: hypothetical protein NVS3B10_17770 [Polyangiales bacterium]